jgi:ABC-2 type transport system permease protein
MINSLKSEINFLFSGMGMPYEKVCLIVALFVTIIITVVLENNVARDVPVAVIDLDHSRYSQEMVNRIDSSPNMRVASVVYNAQDPQTFLAQDKNYAVIVLPKELEKKHYAGEETTIGLFCDNSNTSLDANIRSAVNSMVAMENTSISTTSTSSGMSLSERILFNPAGSASNGVVQGFLFMFSSMFFTLATIGMVPRLRETGEWEGLLRTGNPMTLTIRLLPYMGCLLVALFVGMAVLRVWGDMVFSGNILEFFLTQFLYLPALGLLSLLFGWGAANPGVAGGRMVFLIPAGFVLGGQSLPMSLYPAWVIGLAHFFPLAWEFNFVRDIIIRGSHLWEMPDILGGFFLYFAAILAYFYYRFNKSVKKELEEKEAALTAFNTEWEK